MESSVLDPLVCKFCRQPIYETETTPDCAGRPMWMRGRWRHVKDDAWACVPRLVDPNCEKPRCHVCGTDSSKHGMFCSVGGPPSHRALPFDYEQQRPLPD